MSTRPSADRPSRRKPRFGTRVLEVRAVQGVGVEEDRHSVVERHAVFRRVGLGLPRVPLEHTFSIYGMPRHAGGDGPGGRFKTQIAGEERVATLVAILSSIALVLSAVGLYAVTAYSVTQRTHEIGVRMALGGQAAQVWSLVLRRVMVQLAMGLALGLAIELKCHLPGVPRDEMPLRPE